MGTRVRVEHLHPVRFSSLTATASSGLATWSSTAFPRHSACFDRRVGSHLLSPRFPALTSTLISYGLRLTPPRQKGYFRNQ